MNFDECYALCIQKIYHRPQLTVSGGWNKSLHIQQLQRCYCENSGNPASACVMRRHYSITYMQLLHGINVLIAVGGVGNLLCGRPSYNVRETQMLNQFWWLMVKISFINSLQKILWTFFRSFFTYLPSPNLGLTPPGLTIKMPVGQMPMDQKAREIHKVGPPWMCGQHNGRVTAGDDTGQNTAKGQTPNPR